jgi:hypothetical protein
MLLYAALSIVAVNVLAVAVIARLGRRLSRPLTSSGEWRSPARTTPPPRES